jgi:hypothetical protein
MNKDAMRIAVAKLCGWTQSPINTRWQNGKREVLTWYSLPNYPEDLNACAEMEKTLAGNDELEDRYVCQLATIVLGEPIFHPDELSIADYFKLATAKAAQR